MEQVYHLIFHFDNKKTDLYFVDQETAEDTAKIIKEMAKKARKEIKIDAIIEEVYSRETINEKIEIGLRFGEFLGPN